MMFVGSVEGSEPQAPAAIVVFKEDLSTGSADAMKLGCCPCGKKFVTVGLS